MAACDSRKARVKHPPRIVPGEGPKLHSQQQLHDLQVAGVTACINALGSVASKSSTRPPNSNDFAVPNAAPRSSPLASARQAILLATL